MPKRRARPEDRDGPSPTVDQGGPRRGRRITVVNDNPVFLELMQDILADEQYRVTVINGERMESIDPIRASDPELLFIDIRLRQAHLTGWEIVLAVRNDDRLQRVPVVLCTAAMDEIRDRAEDLASLPMVEVLVKPFSISELEALLDKYIPNRGEGGRAAPPPVH